MAKPVNSLNSQLSERLKALVSRDAAPTAVEQGIQQLVEETGVSASELRHALEELTQGYGNQAPAALQAWRQAIADFAFSVSNPSLVRGKRPHEVMGHHVQKKSPWFAGVKAELPALIHQEPPRDVTVAGQRFSKDDVASILRSVGRT